MGKNARVEAERWGWEGATSYLRNVQYEKAMINFHSRAFGGFGRPGTAGVWRLFRYRVRSMLKSLKDSVKLGGETSTSVFAALKKRISYWFNGSTATN